MPPRSTNTTGSSQSKDIKALEVKLRALTGNLAHCTSNADCWVDLNYYILKLIPKQADQISSSMRMAALDCIKSIVQHGPSTIHAAVSAHDDALVLIILGVISLVPNFIDTKSSFNVPKVPWCLPWPSGVQSYVQAVRDVAVLLPKKVNVDFFQPTIHAAIFEFSLEKSVVLSLDHMVDLHIVNLKMSLVSVSRWLSDQTFQSIFFSKGDGMQWIIGVFCISKDSGINSTALPPSSIEWQRLVPLMIKSLQLACKVITRINTTHQELMESLYSCVWHSILFMGVYGSSWIWIFRGVGWTTRMVISQYERKRLSTITAGTSASPSLCFQPSDCCHLKFCHEILKVIQLRPNNIGASSPK